jgi:nickel transport protein
MKSRLTLKCHLLMLLLVVIPSLVNAHGVKGSMERGGICITAQYDTGEPMSYAQATIRPPGGGLDFQTGRTDRNGRFCFFPDEDGEWNVIVDDGMGHRLKAVVPFQQDCSETAVTTPAKGAGRPPSRFEKAVMGLCVIFGIAGGFLWWRSRRGRPEDLHPQGRRKE